MKLRVMSESGLVTINVIEFQVAGRTYCSNGKSFHAQGCTGDMSLDDCLDEAREIAYSRKEQLECHARLVERDLNELRPEESAE